jgi:hypothetical protein
MTYRGNYKYNILKVFKHFIWKFLLQKTFSLEKKDPKKDNSAKCKHIGLLYVIWTLWFSYDVFMIVLKIFGGFYGFFVPFLWFVIDILSM